jgi:hypothetical protein
MTDVQRCPTCRAPAREIVVESHQPWRTRDLHPAYRAIDVLPDLLRAWQAMQEGFFMVEPADVLESALLSALAKLGLTTRESIEAAIRDMEAKEDAGG